MKKYRAFGFFPCLLALGFFLVSCDPGSGRSLDFIDGDITYNVRSTTQAGSDTTRLEITFSSEVRGLVSGDISVSPADRITTGALLVGPSYRVWLLDITVDGSHAETIPSTVTINRPGVSGSPRSVDIHRNSVPINYTVSSTIRSNGIGTLEIYFQHIDITYLTAAHISITSAIDESAVPPSIGALTGGPRYFSLALSHVNDGNFRVRITHPYFNISGAQRAIALIAGRSTEGDVSVENISGIPTAAFIGSLTLDGRVSPTNASNRNIIWTVVNPGETGATITGNNTLTTNGAGLVTIRATVTDGVRVGANYTQEFIITISEFIPVTNITGIPANVTVGTALTLAGTVLPANATNRSIVWTVISPGPTGATITGNVLNTTAAGALTIRATIANGWAPGTNFMQNFNITAN